MPLFAEHNAGLKRVKEEPFKLEAHIQKLIEENLDEAYGLDFVTSEFAPHGDLRIDTFAYNSEQQSFVIIEYKKGSSWSVIDQGYAYLALMLNNKADFVLKFNECCNKTFGLKDVNWEASRVIFVAPSFNAFQRESLGFQDLPFELWEIRRYENNTIGLNQLQASKRGAKLADVNIGNAETKKVQQEVKSYTLDDLFKKGWGKGRKLYDDLAPEILNLDTRLQMKPVKYYVGFRIEIWNVVTVKPHKSSLTIEFVRMEPKDFQDPQNKVTYTPKSFEQYNVHISRMKIETEEDIPYALSFTKQTLAKFSK